MFEKRKDAQKKHQPFASGSANASTAKEAALETHMRSSMGSDSMSSRSTAVIGKTIRITGQIVGEENLVIEGKVEGTVVLPKHDLTIGEVGNVKADLQAKVIKVQGKVVGDIEGNEKVTVSRTGSVRGNITSPRVTLEDGAKFKGSIDMDPAGGTKATPAPKSAPATKSSNPSENQAS